MAADYNRDGFCDIYLLTYADWQPDPQRKCLNDQKIRDICGPTMFSGAQDTLFRSNGVTFQDVSSEMGLLPQNRGLGVVAADFDNNGFIDFAVVNDVQENLLYLNEGGHSFREDGLIWGMAYSSTGEREGSMGVDSTDFNRDGSLDLWYTNYTQQDNSLLKSMSSTGFVHSAAVAKLAAVSRPWVGFGTGFGDFNCDGWDDLYVINGHVAYERRDSPYFQPPQIFQNVAGQSFREVTERGGPYFAGKRSGRGAACVDLDNNGAVDLVVVHQNDPVSVLVNHHSPKSWISLNLVGTVSERDAIGATIDLQSGSESFRKWKTGGGSYLSHNDAAILFSLAADHDVIAIVKWPTGSVERFDQLPPGTLHTLIEGRGSNVEN